jgi:hypothetical protein
MPVISNLALTRKSEAPGAGLPHLFTVQGIACLRTLVSHSPGGSITSLLLRAAMEAALQEAGCGPSPWHQKFKAVLQVITKTWTSSIMTFMADNCIDLDLKLVPHCKLY